MEIIFSIIGIWVVRDQGAKVSFSYGQNLSEKKYSDDICHVMAYMKSRNLKSEMENFSHHVIREEDVEITEIFYVRNHD